MPTSTENISDQALKESMHFYINYDLINKINDL